MFDPFQTFGDPALVLAKQEAMRFCGVMASDDKPTRWLSLLGHSGTGKTMLARTITRFFARHLDTLPDENRSGADRRIMRRGGFKAWSNVMADMLDGDYSGIRDLKTDWFVCLDDIGAEYGRNRELSVAKLYEVLSCRQGKFTVITANLTPEDVNQKMDARIASRLFRDGSVVVEVNAKDFNVR